MIDVLWSEVVVIGALALILLGPKDLLLVLKTIGRFVGKAQEAFHSLKMAIEYEEFKNDSEVKK